MNRSVEIALEYPSCNLCGEAEHDVYHEQEDTRYPSTPRGIFRLVRCKGCGLIYLNPRPTPDSISAFYPTSFYAERPAPIAPLSSSTGRRFLKSLDPLQHRSRRALAEKVSLVVRHQSRPGRLLDIGCAAGEFLVAMKALGWCVEGLEISQMMCDYVARYHDIKCTQGSIDGTELPLNSFDAITFWASLEHVYDPRSALRSCRGALNENGLVVILVPNADSLEERYLSRWDRNAIDIPRHLYHFSVASMTRLLSTEGFEVLSTSHHTLNASDRVTVIINDIMSSLSGRLARTASQAFAAISGDLVSRALACFGRSHSFVVVARKRGT